MFHARVLKSVPGFELAAVVTSRADEVRGEFPAATVVASADVHHRSMYIGECGSSPLMMSSHIGAVPVGVPGVPEMSSAVVLVAL